MLRVIYWLLFYVAAIVLTILTADAFYPTMQLEKFLLILIILPIWATLKDLYRIVLWVPAKYLEKLAKKLER